MGTITSNPSWIVAFSLVALAALLPDPACAQTPPTESSKPVPLFNGKDLTGWKNVNGAPSTWTVKDGMIHCSGHPTGVLCTDRQFENFILEVDWMHHDAGGNAGIFIWSDPITARGQPFTRSIEVQVMLGHETPNYTSQGDVFSIHGAHMKPDRPHPGGWERCLPSESRTKGAGEWNHYRIVAKNGTLKLEVNGKEVSGGYDINPRKGYICLESEGSPIDFKNLVITELPSSGALAAEQVALTDEGFRTLFNGVDLTGWKADDKQKAHWTVDDWTLNYDGKGDHLWSEESFGDVELIVDWRWTGKPEEKEVPVVLPDGTSPKGDDGKPKTVKVQEAGDSGIYLRGNDKSQVNIWCWPIGSGEVYGYRTDPASSPAVRAGVTPKKKADAPIGQWNRFRIRMVGDRLTVTLNGERVIEDAQLPGVPASGPIALQHHGAPIQFGNIYVREIRGGK